MPLNAAGSAIIVHNEFLNTFGRLRSIYVSPQSQVYLGTNNRDGRGAPTETDDRILVIRNWAYMPSATRNAAVISFALFPNSARQQATLRLPARGGHVTVCDLLSRRLREQAVPGTTAPLDLTGLPAVIW